MESSIREIQTEMFIFKHLQKHIAGNAIQGRFFKIPSKSTLIFVDNMITL